eukprot:Gb_28928 [translate_table: standard]
MGRLQFGRSVLQHLIKPADSSVLDLGHKDLPWKSIAQGTIKKLGKAGETVKVAPGYFRNYLMPNMHALPNIDKYAYLVREQRKNGTGDLVNCPDGTPFGCVGLCLPIHPLSRYFHAGFNSFQSDD